MSSFAFLYLWDLAIDSLLLLQASLICQILTKTNGWGWSWEVAITLRVLRHLNWLFIWITFFGPWLHYWKHLLTHTTDRPERSWHSYASLLNITRRMTAFACMKNECVLSLRGFFCAAEYFGVYCKEKLECRIIFSISVFHFHGLVSVGLQGSRSSDDFISTLNLLTTCTLNCIPLGNATFTWLTSILTSNYVSGICMQYSAIIKTRTGHYFVFHSDQKEVLKVLTRSSKPEKRIVTSLHFDYPTF